MPSRRPAVARHRPHVRKQIAAGTPDPIYLLSGEDDVEKSALAARVRRAGRGGAARVQRRAHPCRRRDDRRQARGRRRSLVAAARTLPMMAPRRVVIGAAGRDAARAEARERGRDARARAARGAARSARAADDARARRRRRSTSAARMFKLLAEAGDARRVRRARETSADAERWVRNRVAAASAQIDPARGAPARASAPAPTSSGCATRSIGCCCTRSGRSTSRVEDVREWPDRRRCRTTGR